MMETDMQNTIQISMITTTSAAGDDLFAFWVHHASTQEPTLHMIIDHLISDYAADQREVSLTPRNGLALRVYSMCGDDCSVYHPVICCTHVSLISCPNACITNWDARHLPAC